MKWTQQTPLVLALWGWMQGNFLMIFPQTTNYFLFHHYLYININMKKKHTTTTATATTTHLYNQETSKSFSCTFLVTYMQGRRKIHLKILGAPSVHSKWTKTMWFPLYFFFSPSAESVFVWASYSDTESSGSQVSFAYLGLSSPPPVRLL